MAVAEDLKIQVMMVGGRRCGKTSVLAAMKRNFDELFNSKNLVIRYGDTETLDALEDKNAEIEEYFWSAGGRTFTPDSNPTDEMMQYAFKVGIPGKRGSIKIDFIDYPGEWLTDKIHIKDLKACVEKTQVIIIAIDTPHMMEEAGRFNEQRNGCNRVEGMLKMALEDAPEMRRLVLFVPLKCECYLADGRMNEVLEKTKESYDEIINYFGQLKSIYEVAVTPIFTLGGAMFSHFETDKLTGEIKINEKFRTPEKPIYYFPDVNVKKPEPKYCEQPIVYLLLYLLQLAGDLKAYKLEKAGLFGKFGIMLQEWILKTTSASDYFNEKEIIAKKLKKQGEGYQIIQNPMKF